LGTLELGRNRELKAGGSKRALSKFGQEKKGVEWSGPETFGKKRQTFG